MKTFRTFISNVDNMSGSLPPLPVIMLAATLVTGLPRPTLGATNSVTTLSDAGPGSLRQTIADAAGGDTITFAVTGTMTLTSGELLLDKNLAIIGPGPAALAISGGNTNRLFNLSSTATVWISDLTLRDGHSRDGTNGTATNDGCPGEPGGAILSACALTLVNCVITNNQAGKGGNGYNGPSHLSGKDGGPGGAVYNSGTLRVTNCLITGSRAGIGGIGGYYPYYSGTSGAGGAGGGIYNVGSLWLAGTLISGNFSGQAADSGLNNAGVPGGAGGGLWNGGNCEANRTGFSNNQSGGGGHGGFGRPLGGAGGNGGPGGGIFNTGTLALANCTVNNNWSGGGGAGGSSEVGFQGGSGGGGGGGGGICTATTLLLTSCTIVSNRTGGGGPGGVGDPPGWGGSSGSGGGIYGGSAAGLSLTNCTITANACRGSAGYGGYGGGFNLSGSNQSVVCCTIIANDATGGQGGGIAGYYAPILNSVVALNTGPAPDVWTPTWAAFTSLGHNLIGITNGSAGFSAPGDLCGSGTAPLDPRVAPLAANGGPTLTIALLPGSPAIDGGTALGTPATDQRGILRPQGRAVDIGAYEFQFTTPLIMAARFQSESTFWLQWCGMPNQAYTLQTSSNLVNWSDLATTISGPDGSQQFTDGTAGSCATRYYRLRTANPLLSLRK